MKSPLIELTNLSRVYNLDKAPIYALREISLTIDEGSFVSVVGKSGSGKSTLLSLIAGMDKPSSGEITVAGKVVTRMTSDELASYRRTALGMVFQSFNLIPSMTALENVALPLFFAGKSESSRTEKSLRLLKAVGLEDRANHKPTELSGGEQQRVAIARALIAEPLFILADEPTGNLDSKTGDEVLTLLRQLHQDEGKTIVMITHDMELAVTLSTRIITLKDGQVFSDELSQASRSLV
jgi:ABC-type lipoprotein export system ATPase subunit